MPTFAIEQAREGGALILRAQGYLDEPAGRRLREETVAAVAQGVRHLVLNLEQATVINSPGITQLLELAEELVYDHKGSLSLVGVSALYTEVFQVVGLSGMARVCTSEQDALQQS